MDAPITGEATFETVGYAGVVDSGLSPVHSGSGVKLRYSVSEGRITVVDPHGEQFVFYASDPAGRRISNGGEFIIPASGGSLLPYDQKLTIGVAAVNGVSLSYTRFVTFQNYLAETGMVSGGRFVIGIPTEAMPTSGSANYSIRVIGATAAEYFTNPDSFDGHALGGSTGSFSIDFATGEILTSLHFVATSHPSQPVPRDFGNFSGTGALVGAGPAFTGTFAADSGAFGGGFFGPGAAEMGYTFNLKSGNMDFFGSVAGLKD